MNYLEEELENVMGPNSTVKNMETGLVCQLAMKSRALESYTNILRDFENLKMTRPKDPCGVEYPLMIQNPDLK